MTHFKSNLANAITTLKNMEGNKYTRTGADVHHPTIEKVTAIWECHDGREIRICDMTDSHLQNTINMLDRGTQAIAANELSTLYMTADGIRGEMALMEIDNHILYLEDQAHAPDPANYFALYNELCTEQTRRGLE